MLRGTVDLLPPPTSTNAQTLFNTDNYFATKLSSNPPWASPSRKKNVLDDTFHSQSSLEEAKDILNRIQRLESSFPPGRDSSPKKEKRWYKRFSPPPLTKFSMPKDDRNSEIPKLPLTDIRLQPQQQFSPERSEKLNELMSTSDDMYLLQSRRVRDFFNYESDTNRLEYEENLHTNRIANRNHQQIAITAAIVSDNLLEHDPPIESHSAHYERHKNINETLHDRLVQFAEHQMGIKVIPPPNLLSTPLDHPTNFNQAEAIPLSPLRSSLAYGGPSYKQDDTIKNEIVMLKSEIEELRNLLKSLSPDKNPRNSENIIRAISGRISRDQALDSESNRAIRATITKKEYDSPTNINKNYKPIVNTMIPADDHVSFNQTTPNRKNQNPLSLSRPVTPPSVRSSTTRNITPLRNSTSTSVPTADKSNYAMNRNKNSGDSMKSFEKHAVTNITTKSPSVKKPSSYGSSPPIRRDGVLVKESSKAVKTNNESSNSRNQQPTPLISVQASKDNVSKKLNSNNTDLNSSSRSPLPSPVHPIDHSNSLSSTSKSSSSQKSNQLLSPHPLETALISQTALSSSSSLLSQPHISAHAASESKFSTQLPPHLRPQMVAPPSIEGEDIKSHRGSISSIPSDIPIPNSISSSSSKRSSTKTLPKTDKNETNILPTEITNKISSTASEDFALPPSVTNGSSSSFPPVPVDGASSVGGEGENELPPLPSMESSQSGLEEEDNKEGWFSSWFA